MGSGYNTSLAMGRSARRKSSTRTPFHFYLNVPAYEYELECGHSFRSRTPMIANAEENERLLVWCDHCREYMFPYPDPVNQPVSNDEAIAFEQDKGILMERLGIHLQGIGFLQTDADIAITAHDFGIPVKAVKQVNAALNAPEITNGAPDMCQKGLHEMTPANTVFMSGRRRCRACKLEANRLSRLRVKAA